MSQVLRATLEAVISSQERLRQMLDQKAEMNQPINSEVERQEFMHLLSYSTLGFGSEITMRFYPHGQITEGLLKKDIETICRWISYEPSNTVLVPIELFGHTIATHTVQISELWVFIRNSLFSVYPIALKHACSMSKEQEGTKKATGYSIEGDNENQENPE